MTLSAYASAIRTEQQRAQQQHVTSDIGRWTHYQREVTSHVAVLEQATMAALEGYLGGSLYYRAAHTAQQLLALVQTMAWSEGTAVAHEIAHLFHTETTLDLVQAFHLSELIAALYREVARMAVGQTPTRWYDAVGYGHPEVPRPPKAASLPGIRV